MIKCGEFTKWAWNRKMSDMFMECVYVCMCVCGCVILEKYGVVNVVMIHLFVEILYGLSIFLRNDDGDLGLTFARPSRSIPIQASPFVIGGDALYLVLAKITCYMCVRYEVINRILVLSI